jgi:putative toxin-antitoxin system antitoxin component (TIGR02293 family)
MMNNVDRGIMGLTPKARGRTLGVGSLSVQSVVKRVEEGFEFSALSRFQKAIGLSLREVAELVGIPARTMVRRRAAGRLGPDESERLLRLSTVFEHALDLFEGDLASARNWLMSPKKALGGETPLWFSRTEIGGREVEALIGRLQHGVFS